MSVAHEEEHVILSLAALCKEFSVTHLVQVGAGDGYEGFTIGQITGCSVTAIEGDTRCEPCAGGVPFYHAIIGSKDGQTVFYPHNDPGLSGTLPREKDDKGILAPSQRLSTFCTEHDITPDALVIDTEGTTLDVLKGCGVLLDGVKLIYAECQNSDSREGIHFLPEVAAFLEARGFTRRKGLPAYAEDQGQGNFCWVKP